jgi:hypothetical protein
MVLAGWTIFSSAGTTVISQQTGSFQPMQDVLQNGESRGRFGAEDSDPVLKAKRFRLLNIERQKQLVADTAKLLRLTGELNAEIAAENTGALTAIQLHKLGEIEKLAHSVKEKMIIAAGDPPHFQTPISPIYR